MFTHMHVTWENQNRAVIHEEKSKQGESNEDDSGTDRRSSKETILYRSSQVSRKEMNDGGRN